MAAGDVAVAGDSATVRDVGSDLRGRTFATDVGAKLIDAAAGLGQQSGGAVSVDRLMAVIYSAMAPADLMQLSDQTWGDAAETLGAQMEDIATRTRSERAALAEAKSALASKQSTLETFDALIGDDAAEEQRSRRGLTRAVDDAEETVASSEQRLDGLDEERRGVDATAATSIGTVRSEYVSARNAIPPVPQVSAGVSVSVAMPDGSVQSVSAVDLAELKDPAAIRAVWDAMTPEQRDELIADFPMLIGNLEGIPLRDRNAANAITAQAHRTELEKQIELLTQLEQRGARGDLTDVIAGMKGEVKSIDAMLGDRNEKYADKKDGSDERFGEYLVYDENGLPSFQKGTVIVGFNPLRDSYITFQGALDPVTGDVPTWMKDVGVVVPGTTSRLATFTHDLDRGKSLMRDSGKKSGYLTWHGSPMPEFDLSHLADAAQRGFADVAAPRLASFVNSLTLPPGTDVIPIGHSYGVVALAQAEAMGLRADRVVYVAPAGLGESAHGIDEFPETGDAPHFSVQARNDAVVGVSQGLLSGLGLGHGLADPLEGPGITRLETGYLDHDHPEKGTIESKGPVESHTAVFTPGSTSMRNITKVVTGDPVSLYHDDEPMRTGGPPNLAMPGSGAAHPEELISPLTLEEVDG